jgi:hypothetical protein
VNVINHNESTRLLKKCVEDTRYMMRNDMSYTKIADAIKAELATMNPPMEKPS